MGSYFKEMKIYGDIADSNPNQVYAQGEEI